MLLTIAFLIVGIVGFVKGRINLTAKKELRGGGLYAVATLFCLPLPLSFLAGVLIGASHAASQTPIDKDDLLIVGALTTWLPILAAFILAFVMAKPKVPAGAPYAPYAPGFPVQMNPGQYPPPGQPGMPPPQGYPSMPPPPQQPGGPR